LEKHQQQSNQVSVAEEVRKKMHWLTLSFRDEPELEDRFLRSYTNNSLKFVRVAFLVVIFILIGYLVWSISTGEKRTVLRIVLTVIAALGWLTTFTRFFRMYFFSLMFLVMLIAGIARTLLVSSSGVVGLSVHAIAVFMVSIDFPQCEKKGRVGDSPHANRPSVCDLPLLCWR